MRYVTGLRRFSTLILLACSLILTSQPIYAFSTAGTNTLASPQMTTLDGTITLDVSASNQLIEGFGASGAWWAQDVGGWEDEKRNEVVRLLFDREKGIGLSVYRYNLGGGDGLNIQDKWRRAETFEVAKGEYDWSRDANALWVLKAAKAAGVEEFVAFVNSPPARMTISGLTTGEKDGKSNLRPEMYGEFAQYMIDVVRHLRDQEGIPIGWISPINEPQWDWNYKKGQEGAHYTPAEVAQMTKVLVEAIRSSGLDIKVSPLESGQWKQSEVYIDKLLGDPTLAPALDHLAIHSYWSTRDDKARLVRYLAKYYPNTRLWMTEWTEMVSGRDTTMDSAMVLANTLYDDLTVGGVTSWQYWIAVSRYDYRDGLIYVNLLDHSIIETKRLWVMGNYSRFVRPGYTRIDAGSSLNTLQVTAYRAADKQQLVLVINNTAAKASAVQLTGIPAEYKHVAVYETSADKNLETVYSGPLPQTVTLAPLSVTTLVLTQ